jgi:hypothetical protein
MMARHQKRSFGEILLAGANVKIGAETVAVLARDGAGKILICSGLVKPTNAGAGYAAGCIFIKTDTGDLYFNTGTSASCTFDLQGVVGAGTVTLAMLAAGIAPSHIAVYGEAAHAGADGASTLDVANAGFLETDIPMVNMRVNASSRAILKVTMSAGHMLITWSGNVALTDTFDYVIYRAAA